MIEYGERVYIAGAGGMLGAAVHEHFSARYEVRASDKVARTEWLRTTDVADIAALEREVDEFAPALIINLAAQTDLEWCERNPEQAWRDNALGAENGAIIAEKLGIPYVYISTAGIFGGEKDRYHDFDAPNPLTVYARSKYHGELFTERHVTRFFVLRAGWMMGGGPELDKKFVNKIYQQIKAGAREVYAVTDKLGTPTYTKDFARGIETVVRSGRPGVYNQVCGGSASRYDVAAALVEELGVDVEVIPVTSDHFAKEYFAERPASEQLVNMKLDARGINVMRDWREALSEYALEFKADLARVPVGVANASA
jgi:dTDP-4-dehydrorhamnose reductase